MADRLGMSLDKIKMETSISQFVQWMEYLKWEINHAFHRKDFLAAILATEIRRSYVKHPNRVKLTDFPLPLKFDLDGERKKEELSVQERTSRAKRFAFGIAGLIGKGKQVIKRDK